MEKQNPELTGSKKSNLSLYILVFILLIVGSIIIYSFLRPPEPNIEKIVIAGKDFAESSILLEMMAIKLEELGATVERLHNYGKTSRLISALENGQIHAYPDYSGTFLAEIVKDPSLGTDKNNHTYQRLNYIRETKLAEAKPYKILHPFKVNNSYEIVMLRDSAASLLGDDLTLSALSETTLPEGFRGGFSQDVPRRPDGLPGLERVYGLRFQDWIVLDHGRKYDLLQDGTIDLADGYSTDAELFFKEDVFAIIKDDKDLFPDYYPIPMVRKEVLQWYPKIEESLKIIADRVDNEVIAKITRRLKEQKITVDDLQRSEESRQELRKIIMEFLKEIT